MKTPVFTGNWGNCHIQGIAVDKQNGYIYYSFTTKLVKATLDGEIVGVVDGLVGHLGCIAFNENDGCVYGSLEYKNDIIGKGILASIGSASSFRDAFYIVRFEASKIDKPYISAEDSGIMTAVYLREVCDDYNGTGTDKNGNTVQHRYGCSGIDGVTFGPIPGDTESNKMYLYVAYGIYGDVDRNDNNNQILLCYDTDMLNSFAQRLDQKNMHTSGPEKPLHKYFVYTGNTVYGVQNLEYDRYTKAFLMAVYKGKKTEFPNYSLFAVDACRAAEIKTPAGLNEKAEILYLKQTGLYDEESGISGWHFPYGSTGLYSFGDGNWLISHNQSTPEGQCSYIHHYIWNDLQPFELNNKK